ncbi:HAD family phosphatase [Hafnia alvei]|uniref:HAD family phosphatase n=2 Tax=Hafnia alvei TaxID=569 RepID=A0ABD7QAG7_HAFAL|nr:HAD family phosphatase [Hafnia alvei]
MDGVLIDAREWHYNALNQVLTFFGIPISREKHLGCYDGLPTRDKLLLLSQETGLPIALHSFINEMKQHYTQELINQHCYPVFQHQYALSRLRHEGFKLAVASNSICHSIEVMLERAKLLSYLDFFMSNEDVKHGKPDPEIYIKAMTRMEITPRECVIVEDSPHGVQAARDAGAHVMVVSDPSVVTYDSVNKFILNAEESMVCLHG